MYNVHHLRFFLNSELSIKIILIKYGFLFSFFFIQDILSVCKRSPQDISVSINYYQLYLHK